MFHQYQIHWVYVHEAEGKNTNMQTVIFVLPASIKITQQ